MADSAAEARAIVDANEFMTLATADLSGMPWASPVWFAHDDYTAFIWASKPGARHSRNLADRPEVAIVIFDSTARPGATTALYVEATAEQLYGADLDAAIETYSRRSQAFGLPAWAREALTEPAPHRLYRATTLQAYVLDDRDRRVAIRTRP